MTDNNVEYVLRAKDDASAVVGNVLRQFQGIDATLSKIASIGAGAGAIGLVTGSLLASATAAVASGKAMADYVEQLDRSVQTTGISSERLQVMQRVLKEGGGDVEGLTTALVKFNRALSENDPILSKIGVTAKDPFEAFMQLSRAISESSDAKARDAVSFRLLGRAGADLVADLGNLVAGFDSTNEAMRRTGVLIDDGLAASARALDTQLDALGRNWDGVMTRMKSVAIPVAAGIASAFNDMWDAISGADKSPGIADIDRRLSEIGQRIRNRSDQENHPGKSFNALTFENAAMSWLVAEQARLLEERNRLTQGRDDARRSASLHDTGTSGGDTLARALAELDASRRSFDSGRSPLLTFGMDTPTAAESYVRKLRAGDQSALGSDAELTASLTPPTQKAKEDVDRLAESLKALDPLLGGLNVALVSMQQRVIADISSAVDAVAFGALQIDQLFKQIMDSIIREAESALLKLGVGLGLEALSLIPGLGWLGPIGAGVSGVPLPSGGHSAMAPAGGNTFNISTLNAKDLIQEIVSPTGQLRQANDRIRDVARAGAL